MMMSDAIGTPLTIQEINDNIDNLLDNAQPSEVGNNWCFVSTVDPNRFLLVSIVDQSKLLLQNIDLTASCKYIETESLQYLLVAYDKDTDTLNTQDVSELLLYQLNSGSIINTGEISISDPHTNPILTQFLHEKWVLKNDRN